MENALSWLVGFVGVPLVNFVKMKFGLEGKMAMLLVVVVSVLLALASLFVSKEMELADFSLANFFAAFGQVLAAATMAYKLLQSE
jgi:hypothetical protein